MGRKRPLFGFLTPGFALATNCIWNMGEKDLRRGHGIVSRGQGKQRQRMPSKSEAWSRARDESMRRELRMRRTGTFRRVLYLSTPGPGSGPGPRPRVGSAQIHTGRRQRALRSPPSFFYTSLSNSQTHPWLKRCPHTNARRASYFPSQCPFLPEKTPPPCRRKNIPSVPDP